MKTSNILFILAIGILFSSCSFLFGSKKDETVDEILEQGAIDPNLIPNKVGYVPILPIWDNVAQPIDVFVGYDEMVYVIDANGLNVFDQKGTKHRTIAIPDATDVTQDRKLQIYVLGRIDKDVDGTIYNLAAVYKIGNTAGAGNPNFLDTLIHPFNDQSRNNSNFRASVDEAVEFTGIATLADNRVYLARKGPSNSLISTSLPDNSMLIFDETGNNIGFAQGLNPINSSLKSFLDVNSISSFAAPPQLVFGINNSSDFLLTQSDANAEYKVLWIQQTINPDTGPEYNENAALLDFDTSRAERFLYQSFRFENPIDICIAPDASRYIFVLDSEKDSLFQFTNQGYEGVNPPANSGLKKQIIVSFGGEGDGPFQFNEPSGVAYFKRTLFIADKNNNRIMRFRLSTDLE